MLLVRNSDARPSSYENMKDLFRPSHADYTYEAKYGLRNWQGGGRASARETIGRVAAAAIARKILAQEAGIEVLAWVNRVQNVQAKVDASSVTLEQIESNIARCPDQDAAEKMIDRIDEARRREDSLGGVVSCCIRNVPAGLGEPVFDKLSAQLAGAMFSLPAVKGFEIGSGFAGTELYGSEHNDPFVPRRPGTTLRAMDRGSRDLDRIAPVVFRAGSATANRSTSERSLQADRDDRDQSRTDRRPGQQCRQARGTRGDMTPASCQARSPDGRSHGVPGARG